jgi:hypothetical protein
LDIAVRWRLISVDLLHFVSWSGATGVRKQPQVFSGGLSPDLIFGDLRVSGTKRPQGTSRGFLGAQFLVTRTSAQAYDPRNSYVEVNVQHSYGSYLESAIRAGLRFTTTSTPQCSRMGRL